MLPVILYLFFYKKITDEVLRVVAFINLIGFTADACNTYFGLQNKTSFSIVNSYALLETLFLLYIFYIIISNTVVKRIIPFVGGAYTLFWIINFINEGSLGFIEILPAVEAIAVIGLTIYYFFEELQKPDNFLFYFQPRFWIVTPYLLYSSGTLFLFLFQDNLSNSDLIKFYVLHSFLAIVKAILLSLAMVMRDSRKIDNAALFKGRAQIR